MAKAIREAYGKGLLTRHLQAIASSKDGASRELAFPAQTATVTAETDFKQLAKEKPWLETEKLVVKPDQLLKRRGKLGLVRVNATLSEVQEWISERMGRELVVEKATGKLCNFIVEPFLPHKPQEEFYVSILANRQGNMVLFHHEGGVDVGDVDSKASKVQVDIESSLTEEQAKELVSSAPPETQSVLVCFLQVLYEAYSDLYFTLLEINPLVIQGQTVHMLDLAAKLDSTAEYLCKSAWGDLEFPPPFGRDALPEEAYIADLDAKSGASLKLTVLNPKGRVWTMVAGGGASVVYSDTICDLGQGSELANYGEYSGAPSESQTYEYAKTILGLMTREGKQQQQKQQQQQQQQQEQQDGNHPQGGKVLIIGGGIANFTNVAATFKGIVRALADYQHRLVKSAVRIFVRRGGPNFQEGLRVMRETGAKLGLPMWVFGPETHMTAIVGMGLGTVPVPVPKMKAVEGVGGGGGAVTSTPSSLLGGGLLSALPSSQSSSTNSITELAEQASSSSPQLSRPVRVSLWTADQEAAFPPSPMLFTNTTVAIIWGMHPRAVQGMLDYDLMCSRETPSVAAMVYPFSGNHKQKFYWGHKEIMIPVYKDMSEAVHKHPEADVLVNFASLRSAYEATVEAMSFDKFRTIAIIAEGIPENKTKRLIKLANRKNVTIIGPATVGGIKPGCFKIGNTGGMMDNIVSSRLYRPGSVAYVSRSGGMSNELNNIISRTTNGVYEGVAIGGDRYPGTTFMDHVIRYHDDPNVKMIVVLGEVGGIEEYCLCEALKSGRLFKPVVAWCIGTCASMFTSEVQFGHAGACANADRETAAAKNKALILSGAHVPDSFDTLGTVIGEVYEQLVSAGLIVPLPEREPPTIPMDYKWAQELGLIRKPAAFMSTICDERGEELLYAGMPISDVFKEDIGIGGVLSLLWFQRRLPDYACKFLEMCLMVTADHGPAVSGAHNTIVTARAGKDLVSSLASGLLTIGDRFGGALDGAARQFSEAYDSNMLPVEFVNAMRKQHKLIMGIGHKVKSLNNPDMRVVVLKDYAKTHFPSTPLLDYAIQVEKITTSKKPNLILNVDGAIATSFVDLLRHSGAFTSEEVTEYIEIGSLNGLFVLGRTMGFIGHYLDQKRLKQGLYRHPWDDISYISPDTL